MWSVKLALKVCLLMRGSSVSDYKHTVFLIFLFNNDVLSVLYIVTRVKTEQFKHFKILIQ